jgi:hypothetical protein
VSKTLTTVVVCFGLCASAQAAVTVTAESDRAQLHVGDKLLVTVRASRPDHRLEPIPSHAALQLGAEWQAGTQTAESEQLAGGERIKVWHFELTALEPLTSSITPVVILTQDQPDAPALVTNRVLGAPIAVEILPARVRPWWLPHPTTIALVAGIAVSVFAAALYWRRRRQRAPRRASLTPLQEALAMMQEVHANCREDRAARFFADVERVLTGYLSRRLARPLNAATASEIAARTRPHVSDGAAVDLLQVVLLRCSVARFSGAPAEHAILARTEEEALAVLERLDAGWVSKDSSGATSPSGKRT